MMDSIYDYSFIIGPHSPLSLPLQHVLARNPRRLREVGAEFPPVALHRDTVSDYLTLPTNELSDISTQTSYLDTVLKHDDTRRIIYDYDAFIGSRKNALDDGFFYPGLEGKIGLLAELTRGHRVTVFLCICHFTRFVETELRNTRFFQNHRGSYPESFDISWGHFVRRIQEIWPAAMIRILNAERLAENWASTINLITGHPEPHKFAGINKYPASCMTDTGKTLYLTSLKENPPETIDKWTHRTSQIFLDHGSHDALLRRIVLSPWTEEQIRHSKSRFAADITYLRNLDNVVLTGDLNWDFQ